MDFDSKDVTMNVSADRGGFLLNDSRAKEQVAVIEKETGVRLKINKNHKGQISVAIFGPTADQAQLARFHVGNMLRFEPSVPKEPPKQDRLLYECDPAQMESLQRMFDERWRNSDWGGELIIEGAWQVRNPYLKFHFERRKEELEKILQQRPHIIEGFHGTRRESVLPICQNSFDAKKRVAEAYGPGNYFARDPNVSTGYCRGDCYMLVCKLMLGQEHTSLEQLDGDHIWVGDNGYYIIAHPHQILPMYVIKWNWPKRSAGSDYEYWGGIDETHSLAPYINELEDARGQLRTREFGAIVPGAYNRKCSMTLPKTKHIWMGYLMPSLTDELLKADVEQFLHDCKIEKITVQHESLRRAAWVDFEEPITLEKVKELNEVRTYHGNWKICVEDVQPDSPFFKNEVCPRMKGRGKYCRAENLKFVKPGCWFQHPPIWKGTRFAEYHLEDVDLASAKGMEVVEEFMSTAPFDGGSPKVMNVKKIVNNVLHHLYEQRRQYSESKHATGATEVELYHGTNMNILDHIYTHGLRPPSDIAASDNCPVSGKKGLATSLCDNKCPHCTKPHSWNMCHMYGLGIYLADRADKSHRYISCPIKGNTYKMIKCRVTLGNSFLISGHLKDGKGMHDFAMCEDPSDKLEFIKQVRWAAEDHDSFMVKGLGHKAVRGRSVINSEYIVFTPYQCLPMYEITYTLAP
eukprot:TRINITY_DN21043_c0_g1_i1.p1 TRINITY_DN21043_c0_g1~~TRINITY_DN21043_c0_g1_i1.p1  ORF type:complete len:701 (-),score=69.49 TRINITY_DN21043_c0_g1_i1:7-2073(-)